MPWMNLAAIGVGAAIGAWTRWGLSLLLNPIFTSLPLGTLAANLIGGLLVGIVIALAEPLSLSVATRLFLVTGFLGGLTTFSTFSSETVALLMKGQAGASVLLVFAHVTGSLALTGAGVLIARAVLAR